MDEKRSESLWQNTTIFKKEFKEMKAMMLRKFLLVVLVFCVGFGSANPSAAEFNLFCRIMRRADDLMYGPDYVYDENVDKEIIKEMMVLYNATTDNMKDFRQTLWVTKDFFEEHPPPTDAKNRQAAHREIEKLIREGEKKIEENRGLAEEVNKKINEAKLSVAKGIFGEHVNEVPKEEKNLTEILENVESIFNSSTDVAQSCGGKGDKAAGKTMLNDFFCVCVGEGGDNNPNSPCSAYFVPPKNGNKACCKKKCCKSGCCVKNNCCNWSWTQMKHETGRNPPLSLAKSIKIIEELCKKELLGDLKPVKDMNGLLTEYVGMIWDGKKDATNKKFFGHSERKKSEKEKVEKCDGTGKSQDDNQNICVDYTSHFNKDGKTYDIPWHNKFKNYSTLLKDAKQLEEKILKNRADLLLLKSKAWVAYSREKDDETSNLDDMNSIMAEKKSETREYVDVSEETTQPSQPSQPVQGQGAPGNPPHYILISSTETSQPSPKKTDEGKGGGRQEPEVTVLSSESTTQEGPSPSQGPSQAASQPPTQSAKRLREEKKTGE